MKILLDTNFFLIPGKFRVDVFRELEQFGKPELYTLDLVVRELEALASGKGRDSRHASLGLDLVRKWKVRILESRGAKTDSEIERIASEQGLSVCTQDRALQSKLRAEGLRVFFLRQGKLLTRLQ